MGFVVQPAHTVFDPVEAALAVPVNGKWGFVHPGTKQLTIGISVTHTEFGLLADMQSHVEPGVL